MSASPNLPLVSVEQYLNTKYPDGDREYLDGLVFERNMGTPDHSGLQKILILHLAGFEQALSIVVLPECRLRVAENKYRVPDVLVMTKPYRQNNRVILDPPLMVVEILSPDDRMRDTIRRCLDYEQFGVRYIILLDPEEQTTFIFSNGNLIRGDLETISVPDSGEFPFNTKELLSRPE